MRNFMNVRFGSVAVIRTYSSGMAGLGWKADIQPGECPLLLIPDVRKTQNSQNRMVPNGQGRTSFTDG
jgi:hypothetical protein